MRAKRQGARKPFGPVSLSADAREVFGMASADPSRLFAISTERELRAVEELEAIGVLEMAGWSGRLDDPATKRIFKACK